MSRFSSEDGDPSTVLSPILPCVIPIPGGLFPGRAIAIRGAVLSGSPLKRFQVNLCCGLLVEGDHQDNKALHLNPRFDTNSSWFSHPDHQIVLNSLVNNKWGVEERYSNVFKEGSTFHLRILVLSEYFKIAVDGKHLCDYLHRIKIEDVQAVHIAGSVRIDSVEFQGEPPHMKQKDGDGVASGPIRKPKLPFELRLKDEFGVGSQLRLTAIPFMQAQNFYINFLSSDEYFLHFRVDFPAGKKPGAVVRNSTLRGIWQKEEREMSEFPFIPGMTFDALFKAEYNCITIQINGSHFGKFFYRGDVLLKNVNRIVIKGDFVVLRVQLD